MWDIRMQPNWIFGQTYHFFNRICFWLFWKKEKCLIFGEERRVVAIGKLRTFWSSRWPKKRPVAASRKISKDRARCMRISCHVELVKTGRTPSLLKMESTFNLCQQVHLWLGTGLCVVSSMLGETRATEKRLPTLQGSRRMRARVPGIAERKAPETRCSLLSDSQTQNKPVVLSRHQDKEKKRNPKRKESCNFGRKD